MIHTAKLRDTSKREPKVVQENNKPVADGAHATFLPPMIRQFVQTAAGLFPAL